MTDCKSQNMKNEQQKDLCITSETKEGEWLTICPRFKPFNYYKILYELFEENTKLKELLKECSPYISRSVTSRMIKNSVGYKKDAKLLAKINQALGEEK